MKNKNLRITIIYQYFGTPKGSWSTRIYELSRRWVKRGHTVTVITSPYSKSDIKVSSFLERQTIEGINLIIINTPDNNKNSFLNRVFNSLVFAVISTFFLLKEKSDIVLASSGPITVGIPALIKKYLSKSLLVFEVRDLWPRGAIELGLLKNPVIIKLAVWFERLSYSNSKLIVSASSGQNADIISRFPNANTLVIPNASDNLLFTNKVLHKNLPDWIQGKKIFLHTGSIGLMNNCQQIINAGKWLKSNNNHNNILIVFIGDGIDKTNLETQAKINNLDFIKFIGLIPKIDLALWVQNSIATILTTSDHPVMDTLSPNKLFDSFAAGKPIIQTTNGWIKELIELENCGLNIKNNSDESLGKAILYLTHNNNKAMEMSENAKKVALKYFDRDVLSDSYIIAIERLIF